MPIEYRVIKTCASLLQMYRLIWVLFTSCSKCPYSILAHIDKISLLTLNAQIATKVVCFSRLLKCIRSLYAKQCGPDQTAPIGAVCSGSTLFASILNLSAMLGNYLQQTTSADNIFGYFFFLELKNVI